MNVKVKENYNLVVGEEGDNSLGIKGKDGEIAMVSKNKMELGSEDDEVKVIGKTKATISGDELSLQGGSKAKLESGDTDVV